MKKLINHSNLKNSKFNFLIFLALLMAFQITSSQSFETTGIKAHSDKPINASNSQKFDCNNNNNITITANGTENHVTYSTPNSDINCAPNANFPGNTGAWTGDDGNGFVTYTFSQPIISANVIWSAVNSNAGDIDVGLVSIDGQGTLSLTNVCGASINGNQLTCNLAPQNAGVIFGNVSVTVSSTCPFTTITLTSVFNTTGWVQGDPCQFTWVGPCAISPPIFNTTSLSNICPEETVDLNSLEILNLEPCYNLTWHSGSPATDANLLSPVDSVGEGTIMHPFHTWAVILVVTVQQQQSL